MAAALLQAAPDGLGIVDGVVVHRDRPGGASIGRADVARNLAPDSPTLDERDPGLAAEGWFRPSTWPIPVARRSTSSASTARPGRPRSSGISERGEPLSVTPADYLMPTVREAPAVEVLVTEDAPSPLNQLGIKSVGEGGIKRDRCGHRRRDRPARRRDAAPGDSAADQGFVTRGGDSCPPRRRRGIG